MKIDLGLLHSIQTFADFPKLLLFKVYQWLRESY